MAELIKNPEMMKRAQSEVREAVCENATVKETDLPKFIYLKSIIKETLRFHPPVPLLLPRESMEECTIKGYTIPAKTRAIVNYWAIARDPAKWENPEEFDPIRFMGSEIDHKGRNFEYIPFGSGRRICPGISYAAVSMELSLSALLFHFDWRLPEGEMAAEMDMGETFGLTMFKSSGLKLVPTLRFPPPPC